MDYDEAEERVAEALNVLREHFDCCQILVSWSEEASTSFVDDGFGNWYARKGMAQEFLDSDQPQVFAMCEDDEED